MHPLHKCRIHTAGFEPMTKLQHGLSSSAANVKETTGLPTGCFTRARASPDSDTDCYMRFLLPRARYTVCVDSLLYVNGYSTRQCCK